MYLMNRIVEYVRHRNMKGLFANICDKDRFHPKMHAAIDRGLNTLLIQVPANPPNSTAHHTRILVRIRNYAYGAVPEPWFHPPLRLKQGEKKDLKLWGPEIIPFKQLKELDGQQLITSAGPTALKIDRLVLAAVMTALEQIVETEVLHGGATVVAYPEDRFFSLTSEALAGHYRYPWQTIVTFSAAPFGNVGYTQLNLPAAVRAWSVLGRYGYHAPYDDHRAIVDGSYYQGFRLPDHPLVVLGAGLRNRGQHNEFTTKQDMRGLTEVVNNIVRKHRLRQ